MGVRADPLVVADAEKASQLRSRGEEILNVPQEGTPAVSFSPAALLDKLFEHPATQGLQLFIS
jgi:hypothetical protein